MMNWFKIIVACVLIGGPIVTLLWFLLVHSRHRGRMDAYDRISKQFQNIYKEE